MKHALTRGAKFIMTLLQYNKKRNFKKTPEPIDSTATIAGSERKKSRKQLIFVVQKHHASHLHYDFRLEMEGVLKSWAVPRGPSLNPSDKRLAMHVEDHPYDYKDFEGTIPKGNYGAGDVIVWDTGTYEPIKGKDLPAPRLRQAREKELLAGLKTGRLTFMLHGRKLNGEFSLIQMKGREKQWLLIKKSDEFASSKDLTGSDKSVLSNRRLGDIGHIGRAKKEQAAKDRNVPFSNREKIFWPKERYTKGDVLDYYERMAEMILPYLKDRPFIMNRHPNGIDKPGFYQKDSSDLNLPNFVETATVRSESDDKNIRYILCNNKKTLLYLANLGCIEMNPWNSRTKRIRNPDFYVIDLDPGNNAFEQVIEVAKVVHEVLMLSCEDSYCKTSGKTGLHIYVPLAAKYDYDKVRSFAELVAHLVHEKIPDITSLERAPAKRRNKIYVDWLQNCIGQTLAAPYSLRPMPGATVSTPLQWREVKKGLDPGDFNIKTIHARLKKKGDLWKPILGRGVDLKKAIRCIEDELKKSP